MGCTYSEEVDLQGLRVALATPALANPEDPAIIGPALPLEAPFDALCGELAVEVHPVTWRGGKSSGTGPYSCQCRIQGSCVADVQLPFGRTLCLLFPITASSLPPLPITLSFYSASLPPTEGAIIDVPAFSAEGGEVTMEVTFDLQPAKPLKAEAPANGTPACQGQVAVTVSMAPHAAQQDLDEPATIRPRLRMQHIESLDNVLDTEPISGSCLTVGRPVSPMMTNTKRMPLIAIMAGVRQAAAACASPKPTLGPADFQREAALKFVLDHGALEVKVFAPQVFSSIRLMDMISPGEFQREWELPEARLLLDEGAGRSGSLFLRSKTNRFILKTIPHVEVVTFLSLLEGYYNHLLAEPDSFIMHVYGLHRFWWAGSWLYVILFANLLHSPSPAPIQIFDLKGRVAKPGKLMARRHEKGIVWKDKDLERFFFLPQAANERYRRQLAADVDFLERHNMMDYSLLIGVQTRPLEPLQPEDPAPRSFFRSYSGGTPGTEDCGEVYFIGIIDCLTQYNSKKKVAHFCKARIWRGDTLSTVPSKEYGSRFLAFMYAIFPTELEVRAPALKHPNLSLPIAALDTLNLNPNQAASPHDLGPRVSFDAAT